MKFTAVLAFIAAATVVSAATNAERLARGLSPNAPGKRATPAARASRLPVHHGLLLTPFRCPPWLSLEHSWNLVLHWHTAVLPVCSDRWCG